MLVEDRGTAMPKSLSEEAIEQYRRDGFFFPVPILEAEDVSGMAFAPLQHADLPGVGIYPAGPEVADSAGRGSLRGRRSETVTYVFERAGTVQIPDIRLTWWNVSTEQLETITLPGRGLEIANGLGGASDAMDKRVGAPFDARVFSLSGAILLVLVVLLLRFARPMAQRWSAWRRRRRESETRYFKRFGALEKCAPGAVRRHALARLHQ